MLEGGHGAGVGTTIDGDRTRDPGDGRGPGAGAGAGAGAGVVIREAEGRGHCVRLEPCETPETLAPCHGGQRVSACACAGDRLQKHLSHSIPPMSSYSTPGFIYTHEMGLSSVKAKTLERRLYWLRGVRVAAAACCKTVHCTASALPQVVPLSQLTGDSDRKLELTSGADPWPREITCQR